MGVRVAVFCVLARQATAAAPTEWQVNAEKAVKACVNNEVATTLAHLTHPMGRTPALKSLTVEPDGEGIAVTIAVKWNGAIFDTVYTTAIRWRFDSKDYLLAEVTLDTGLVKPDRDKLNDVDDYLRNVLLPQIRAQFPRRLFA